MTKAGGMRPGRVPSPLQRKPYDGRLDMTTQAVLAILLSAGVVLLSFAGGGRAVADDAKNHIVVGVGFATGDGRYHYLYDTSFTGDYAMAYATSEDGIHWTRPNLGLVPWKGSRNNNLLDFPKGKPGSWNALMMCSGGALRDGDLWRVYVAGYCYDDNKAMHSQLTLFQGPDVKELKQVVDGPVVPNGPEGTFDSRFVRVPCIIKDGDRFRMYYTANDGKDHWCAGYAESPDGVAWTKPKLGAVAYAGSKDNNLVLFADPSRGERRLAHPWVIKDGDGYRMYYSVTTQGGTYAIGTATSEDGIHWVKDPKVIVLPRGPKGSFDYWYAAIPKVVREGDVYKMWYTGYNGAPSNIEGKAEYAIGYATSPDGVNWTKHEGNPIFGPGARAPGKDTTEQDKP